MPSKPPDEIISQFGVRNPRFVTETDLAAIWKVDCPDGKPAALKIYHGSDMRNESSGFDLLEFWDGNGAAKLLARSSASVLLEWLEGPSLGDLTRSGHDKRASAYLVEVANTLHEQHVALPDGAPDLSEWFEDLFQLHIDQACGAAAEDAFAVARSLAKDLLTTQQDVAWLHGDLHHDNIRLGDRGYCAFDAKGVVGERTYELANAFRNPKGAAKIVRDPERIEFLADLWARTFNVDRQRLLKWAAAKCALSIAWRSGGVLRRDPELDLLSILTKAATRVR